MSLGKRLFIGEAAADAPSGTSDTLDVFGDGNCLALYSLDYDASDASGNHNGTVSGGVTFGVDGQINWGASFDGGSSTQIEIPDNDVFSPSVNDFSVSMWVKPTSGHVMSKQGEWHIRTYGGGADGFVEFWLFRSGGGSTHSRVIVAYNTGITDGDWHHLVVTADYLSSYKIYLDGVKIGENTSGFSGTSVNTSNPVRIGSNGTATTERYLGDLDQVRFFKKSLSQSEVDTLYAETATTYTPTTDTLNYQDTITAYYKFDGNANDETTNYDGTESNITYEFGRFGTAAVFNGTSSYVSLTDIPSSVSADISISAWINADTLSGDRTIISLRENRLIEISINSGYSAGQRLEFKFYDGGNKVINLNENLITVGNWHHICLTAQAGGNMIAYFDGVAQGSPLAIGNVYVAGQGDTIGAYVSGAGGFFDGKIDQVRIYGLLLDATEVANLYNEKQAYITKNASDPFGDNSEEAFYELENNANDSTGSNTGVVNNVTFTSGSGLFGTYAAEFNGSSSDIEINKSVFGTGDGTADVFTISLWFNTTTNNGVLAGTRGNSSTQGFILWLLSDGTIRYDEANATGSIDTLITTNTYDDGNWHNVVVTRNASNQATLYVDGSVQVSTTTITTALTSHTNNLFIGRYTGSSLYYDGLLDQVRIFDRALDGDEVFKLYAEVIN